MAKQWDQIPVLDTSASATPGGVTGIEIPPDVDDLNLQFTQSGTATTITLQGSVDNSNWFQMMSTPSATLHAIAVVPRYLRVITENTADSHITVSLQYRKG